MSTKKNAAVEGEKKINGKQYVAKATLRHVRIAPQKARLVVELIRGKQVEPALQILTFLPKKGARLVEKVLRSAIMNAVERSGADPDRLWVTDGWVDMGRTQKQYLPRAHGRATQLRKRSSHITLLLGEPSR